MSKTLLYYGGSARLWLYDVGFDPACSEWYSAMVRAIVREVSNRTGVYCLDGEDDFEGITMSYHMSWRPRVSVESTQKLKELLASIVRTAHLLAVTSRILSRL